MANRKWYKRTSTENILKLIQLFETKINNPLDQDLHSLKQIVNSNVILSRLKARRKVKSAQLVKILAKNKWVVDIGLIIDKQKLGKTQKDEDT
ncbi:MAG: hypothetical protein IH840_02910 [Candidatus Heimdallarchaeota archaeon]|nr:hypothetical protein [Candidatus Heimdallarchaeota archaeon]